MVVKVVVRSCRVLIILTKDIGQLKYMLIWFCEVLDILWLPWSVSVLWWSLHLLQYVPNCSFQECFLLYFHDWRKLWRMISSTNCVGAKCSPGGQMLLLCLNRCIIWIGRKREVVAFRLLTRVMFRPGGLSIVVSWSCLIQRSLSGSWY